VWACKVPDLQVKRSGKEVAMTTFNLDEVRGFAAGLNDRLARCDNGEGMECATLDARLQHYARLCCEFRECVRQWGRAVFSGRVAFDPEVEFAWMDGGWKLYLRALDMWRHSQRAEVPCYELEGRILLQAALWDLYRLLKPWVTPKRSVGPAARQADALDPRRAEEVRRQLESLPPLPADWKPDDPHQQALYRMLKTS
jgi:hypothetical protein